MGTTLTATFETRHNVHPMYLEAWHVDTLSFIANAYCDDIAIEGG